MAGGRFKELLKKYGKVAFGVHCSVSAVSVSGLYVAIKNNVDIESLLHKWHLSGLIPQPEQQQQHSSDADHRVEEKNNKKKNDAVASAGGAFALAVLCNKALFPIRVPITFALTPVVARFLAKRKLIKISGL